MSVALTGNDTIVLNGLVLTDFADGDVAELKFNNDLVEVVNGKNDNAIFALNSKGKQGEMTIKLLRGSSDDLVMSAQLNLMQLDFPSYVLLNGSFTKRIGNGFGLSMTDLYLAKGGVISRIPDVVSSSDGKTEQAITTYTIKFAKVIRVI
jgi:hypothetical protein